MRVRDEKMTVMTHAALGTLSRRLPAGTLTFGLALALASRLLLRDAAARRRRRDAAASEEVDEDAEVPSEVALGA